MKQSISTTMSIGSKDPATKTLTGSTVYTWEPTNHLVKVTGGSSTLGAYAYDGLGLRVQSVEATNTLYAYLGTETLSEMVPGTTTNDYVYADGLRIAKVSGSTVTYYHTDAIGSTRLETSASGTVLFSENYQPYGQNNGTPTGSETYKFTGKPVS